MMKEEHQEEEKHRSNLVRFTTKARNCIILIQGLSTILQGCGHHVFVVVVVVFFVSQHVDNIFSWQ